METTPMWKRILAWQQRTQSHAVLSQAALREVHAAISRPGEDPMTPAWLAAQKSGVAVQRELAKVMW